MPENLPAVPSNQADLVAIAERFPIFHPDNAEEIKAVLQANLGPRGLDQKKLPRIKWPTGGSLHFVTETLDGEDQPVKELSGFIVAWRDMRLYYKTAYAERGKKSGPPDCSSKDGYTGVGEPGGDCDRCPFAGWGSDPKGGRGQACKQVKQILMLREDHVFPDVINIPPTSLMNWEKYLMRLGNFRTPHWGLITTIRLERMANTDGIDYARATFSTGERLGPAARAAFQPFCEQMSELLKPMTVEDVHRDDGDDDDDPPFDDGTGVPFGTR